MSSFDELWALADPADGWCSIDQARRLYETAAEVADGGRIVEIGSYRGRSMIIIAGAAATGVEVVAIDPHGGNDRGPQQWEGTVDEGQGDHERFWANLRRAGVADRVRHLRMRSQDAHDEVGDVDMLYIDGAHGAGPARDDIVNWGAKVPTGGTMLIHDSYSSIGVTAALMSTTFIDARWRYLGRDRSLARYERVAPMGVAGRLRNAAAQCVELPWFGLNLVRKALVASRITKRDWPY